MEKKEVRLLRSLLLEADEKSKDINQLFLRLWDILDYLDGNKTEEFNQRLEKEYEMLKEKDRIEYE